MYFFVMLAGTSDQGGGCALELARLKESVEEER
jgi:hypothetical protein